MSCPYCRQNPHTSACVLRADLSGFTPQEIADLNVLRNCPDPFDLLPLGYANGEPVPWVAAINLDPARY